MWKLPQSRYGLRGSSTIKEGDSIVHIAPSTKRWPDFKVEGDACALICTPPLQRFCGSDQPAHHPTEPQGLQKALLPSGPTVSVKSRNRAMV